jgi:hypothetical protein
MRSIAVAALWLVSAAAAGTHTNPLSPLPGRENDPVTPLVFDQEAYAALKGAAKVTFDNFPIGGGQTVTLELHAVEVLGEGARVVVSSGEGDREAARPDVVLLAGGVAGVPGATAFLGLSPFGSGGIIEVDGHRHILSSGPFGAGLDPVVYDMDALPEGAIQWREFTCGADLLNQPGKAVAAWRGGGGGVSALPCRVAKVAVESDYEYTLNAFGGSTDAAAAYALVLMGADSEIYTREINTRFEVTFLRVWVDDSDMYSGPSSIDRLYQMQEHWSANMGQVDRTITHMLTAVRGDTGGVAWLGVLCDKDFGYGLSDYIEGFFPYPLIDHSHQNWDLMVTAHEIGHNFGSPHTHDVQPPVDGCGLGDCSQKDQGTIMSYCHTCQGGMSNISLNLHPRMINEEIVPYLDGNNGCKLIQKDPGIFQQPEDAQSCPGGEVTFLVLPLGDPNPAYQWRKDGVDIPGADEFSYTIQSVTPDDEGGYSVVVSNACAEVVSETATLDVVVCGADLNGDCELDLFDFLAFQNLFADGDPTADCDQSGALDLFDFLCFQNLFADGCG